MNADRLLAHYERMADAPDAIARLRRFILDLAVRGKLVEQDPNDEPAAELLERVAAEKARRGKVGKPRMRKPAVLIVDQPLDLPSGWSLTRLAIVAECLDYMRKPINGTERKQRIAGKSQSELFPYFGATQQQGWIDDYIFDEELILLGEDGVPFFEPLRAKAYLIAGKSWVNNHAHVFRGILISPPYLVHYLNVFDYSGRVVGATRSKLNQSRALDIPIPLPPLAEQHRIVAKVDELMALCDRLEAARTERESTRDQLSAASLVRLNAPDLDPVVFRNHAAFALENLVPLTTRTDQIKSLRQTILNLAVRGKLVKQNPNDEPASELLKRIAAEKTRLVKAGEIRQPKTLPPIQSSDIPVESPSRWIWTRLGNASTLITKGSTPTSYGHAYTDGGINFIKVEAIKDGQLRPENVTSHISEKTYDYLARSKLFEGDILFSIAGSIGTCAIVSDEILPANTNQALSIIRGTNRVFFSKFLLLCLQSSVAQFIHAKARGGAMNNISLGDVASFVIPLPPLAEQHRIVAKVDELMTLCDQLEASLTTGDETRCRLLDALLYEALPARRSRGPFTKRNNRTLRKFAESRKVSG